MKHPIYRDLHDRNMMTVQKDYGRDRFLEMVSPSFTAAGQTEQHCKAYVNRIGTLIEVERAGLQLIMLRDAEHWDESMSEKTIKQMSVSDILMPFPAFTIDLTNAAWSKYEYAHVVKDENGILFIFELLEENGTRYHQMQLEFTKNIEHEVDTILTAVDTMDMLHEALGTNKSNMREIIYKCIGIIMYTSMFQKVTDKVLITKIVNKGSKKRNIPTHNTSVIYLSQPTYKLSGRGASGTRNSSDKTWMQKGHFRRQPYGKRAIPLYRSIWIDAMWKGSGAKVIGKVFKL